MPWSGCFAETAGPAIWFNRALTATRLLAVPRPPRGDSKTVYLTLTARVTVETVTSKIGSRNAMLLRKCSCNLPFSSFTTDQLR